MSARNARKDAIAAIADLKAPEPMVDYTRHPVTEVFGANVFNDAVMRARLPKATYTALRKTIDEGAPLDPAVADVVANAMKDWAIEQGAT
ncbi:MAG TPA: glutamine synthetase III, partial [Armatimonadota bacterium]|nr:glutamine synthetase III [Armatimonadota bacterium]